MILANYFETNSDLVDCVSHGIPWEEIVPLYENQFADSKEYLETGNSLLELAPSSVEEAKQFYIEVLRSCGEISGKDVAAVAKKIESQGLQFAGGQVTHPPEMVQVVQKYREAGLGAVGFRRRFGGLGVPNVVKAIVSELMYRSDSSVTIAVGSLGLASILESYATPEMQTTWIPKLLQGNYSATMGLSEPDFGSDLPNVMTKAEKKGENWYLTGTKRYQTMACGINGEPAVTLVLARTGSLESGARGLSFFLVENSEYQIQSIETKMGIKASATCEVVYENSKGYLIGKEGYGLVRYVMGMLNGARLSVASQGTGLGTAAWEEAKKYAKERIQFGKPISEIPAVKRMLSHLERESIAMRSLMIESALSVDRYHWGQNKKETADFWEKVANTLTPIAKYYNSEMSNQLVYEALQVFGGAGFTEDYDIAKLARDARITTIYDGTSQIQVNAAIGGILTGVGENGIFRRYIYSLLADCADTSFFSTQWQLLEASVSLFKSNKDQEFREAYALEIVSSAARVLLSVLWEKRKKSAKGSTYETLVSQGPFFHADSLATLEGNLKRMQSILKLQN